MRRGTNTRDGIREKRDVMGRLKRGKMGRAMIYRHNRFLIGG